MAGGLEHDDGAVVRELIAWQKAMDLAESVYRETGAFPIEETYGLRAQVRRSAVSVPSNIAEGQGRKSTRELYASLEEREAKEQGKERR